ncbi:MAG: hypothetical protein JO218_15700 [Burkholderiales bacterium]|nr:hypothetical protein [Burkholderiales bacterium]
MQPLRDALKQVRNDLWLHAFCSRKTPALTHFLKQNAQLQGQNIGLIIAFEQPWALEWLLRQAGRHLHDTTLLVFDNSRCQSARREIADVCRRQHTPYLALPFNRTRHVNRSHGLAMSWVYRNVVRAMKPARFAFIDHDLIPVDEFRMDQQLGSQPCYGLIHPRQWGWHLWAGYSLFDYEEVADLPLNFLYDFSRDLDTGGRNWSCFYRNYAPQDLRGAEDIVWQLKEPVTGEVRGVNVIDQRWLHIGSISYNDNFQPKFNYFQRLAAALDGGATLAELRVG